MRRAATVAGLFAVLCLVLGAVLAATAGADRAGNVLLSVNGADFTAAPDSALFDTSSLAPGRSVSAKLGVRSAFGVGTKLTLGLIDVHDDDNGCTAAESEVDKTCGAAQGDLGAAVVMTVDLATRQAGPYRTVWSGSAERLSRSVTLEGAVPAKGERWVRVTAAVPGSVGNIVQSDSITFGARVVLSGNGAHGGSDIAGVHTSRHGGSHDAGSHDTASQGTEGLATTGFSVVLLLVGAASLLLAGTMMAFAGIRRRLPGSGPDSG